jgi:hypothetical protein
MPQRTSICIAADGPTRLQGLPEGGHVGLRSRLVLGSTDHHAYFPHPLALLRSGRARPRRRRAAKKEMNSRRCMGVFTLLPRRHAQRRGT